MKRENDELKIELSIQGAELFEDTFAGFEENAEVTDAEKQRVLSSVMRKAGFEMNGIISENRKNITAAKSDDTEVRRGRIQVKRSGTIAACIAVLAVGAVTAGILHNNNIIAAAPDKYTLTAGSTTSDEEDSTDTAADNSEEFVVTTADVTADSPVENTMPDMVGKMLTDMVTKYEGKLKFDIVSEYNEEYEEGMIYAQSIPAGTAFSEGDKVTVKVSHNKDMSVIPDVTGKNNRKAEDELRNAGFTVVLKGMYDDEIPEGCVIKTEPPAGEKAKFESIVTMYVSKGKCDDPDALTMPEVRGMTADEAVELLKESGISAEIMEIANSAENGMVVDQSVESGRKLLPDTTVVIYVSTGISDPVDMTLSLPLPGELHGT